LELLWTDFLNSDYHDWRGSGRSEDRLDKPDWLAKFVLEQNLPSAVPPTLAELAALKALRTLLHGMAEALAAGDAPSAEELAQLNRVMAGGPVTRRLTSAGARYSQELAPVRQDWAQAMAEIAASFAGTLATGESTRVRVCENPDCLWFFYDDTRNRTKRFCDDKLCGNLMKVRRFRARKKAES
jgi:predicted RNA-binding Zn ribbon-like protein